MSRLSMTACSFQLRKKNKRKVEAICGLNDKIDYGEQGIKDFLDIFKEFWKDNSEYQIDDCDEKIFRCDDKFVIVEQNEYRYFFGKIYSGSYGIESEITDTLTGKIVYKKKKEDADIKPFYVFVCVFKDTKNTHVEKGIMFLQNIGPYGIKTKLTSSIKEYISRKYNSIFICGNISPEIYLRKIIDNKKIKKMTVVRNVPSSDKIDSLDLAYGKEERTYTKLIWKESVLKKIANMIIKKEHMIEIDDIEYSDIKFTIECGQNRIKVVRLNNIEHLSIVEDLPQEIQNSNGHPNKQKLLQHFFDSIETYKEKMILQITK